MIENKLNNNQKLSVEESVRLCNEGGGRLLIESGPGTGKTLTIASICTELLKQNKSVMAVTFSKASAKDMSNRVHELCEEDEQILRNFRASTIHSFAYTEIVKPYWKLKHRGKKLHVLSDSKKSKIWNFAYGIVREKEMCETDIAELKGSREASRIRYLRDIRSGKAISHADDEPWKRVLKKYYANIESVYMGYKKENNYISFGDMITYSYNILNSEQARKLLNVPKIDCLVVDEFQDTNEINYEMLQRVCQLNNSTMVVVGDTAQSIYGFTGADGSIMSKFKSECPNATVLSLTDNYRSTQQILDCSDSMLEISNTDSLKSSYEFL